MLDINLEDYSDRDLQALRNQVLSEEERRATLAAAPERITAMTRDACTAGVPDATIRAAVETGLAQEGAMP